MARSSADVFLRLLRGVLSVTVMLALVNSSFAQTATGTLLMQGRVNGLAAVFMVDTGAERSVIDRRFASEAAVSEVGQTRLETTLGSSPSSVVRLASFDIDGLQMNGVQMLTEDLGSTEDAMGSPVNGVIGMDILRRGEFTLDFQEGAVHPTQTPSARGVGRALVLVPVGNLFYVDAYVGTHQLRLLLDTGANLTTLSRVGWEKISGEKRDVVRGLRTSASSAPSQLSCVSHFRLSNAVLNEVPLRLAPQSTSGLLAEPSVDGLLGSDVLSRYVLTTDFSHNKAWLRPVPGYVPDPNRFSSVGIQFVKNMEGSFTVVSVWERSPASLAGVPIGTHIITVAHRSTSDLSVEQMSTLLHGSPGTAVRLTTNSSGVKKIYNLTTRVLVCGSVLAH